MIVMDVRCVQNQDEKLEKERGEDVVVQRCVIG